MGRTRGEWPRNARSGSVAIYNGRAMTDRPDDEHEDSEDMPTRAERPRSSAPASARPSARPPSASHGSSPSRPGTVREVAAQLEARGFRERYVLRRLIGSGGVGEVHLCHDHQIGRDVAIKMLQAGEDGSAGSDARTRFVREARVQGQLEHPAVVPVYDMGLTPDGVEFFTMKRIAGRTLQEILRGVRKGTPEIVREYSRNKRLGVFRHVCLAVDYAHARGVLHRDLKPSNIMVGHFGEVHLLDWGLAKVQEADQGAIRTGMSEEAETMAGQVLGTPGYMAPEQLMAHPDVDTRADVYALGAILFEILTLERLHEGTTTSELVRSTQVGADARPSVRFPERDVPPELEALCVKATSLDPDQREVSARDLAEGVEQFLEGHRDVELRRRLAEVHVQAAEAAAERVLTDAPDDMDARRDALQEAGKALALDPGSERASAVVMRLMMAPPPDPPESVRDALTDDETAEAREAGRVGARGYFAFFLMLGAVLLIGVRDWGVVAAMAVPTLGASATCALLLAGRRYRPWMGLLVAALTFTAIGAVSGLFGALVLVPGLAAANVMALNVSVMRPYRGVVLALGCAAVLVPFALEWAGVLPPSYVFEEGRIVVLPVGQAFPEVVTRLELLAASLVTILIPAFAVWRTTDGLTQARQRLHMQSWQLQQLVPAPPHP
jgi:eukaryotic-like serine/threonine-protein kinase